MSALEVVCEQRDPGGDVCRVEVDPRDGRAYLTVIADGHEAPFELTEAVRGALAWALVGPGIHAAREKAQGSHPAGETVQRAAGGCGR